LYSSSTETLLRSGAMSSRIAQLSVIDTLYAAVCSRIFNQVKAHLEKTRVATRQLHMPQSNGK
ncbi:MAG: RpiR family transcriptional regulator, partial [Eubacteriales bacterium]|nr:RpiR family transcriptional regulator [Eubacteriales bacterium]